jgi:hypothetical protein
MRPNPAAQKNGSKKRLTLGVERAIVMGAMNRIADLQLLAGTLLLLRSVAVGV